MIVRARMVWPVTRPPIENGAVRVRQGRVIWVGPWSDRRLAPGERKTDLGERVLLPGLVNAHAHLDYTGVTAGPALPRAFPDWLQALLRQTRAWSDADWVQSWQAGAQMLLEHGVTSVANIESHPRLLSQVLPGTPLRVFSFLELIQLQDRPPAADYLAGRLAEAGPRHAHVGGWGLAPHAPYSTTPALLAASVRHCRQRHWPWTIHVAESAAELAAFQDRQGPMFDWLTGRRDWGIASGCTPVAYLERQGVLGPRCLAVHANYLTPADIAQLAARRVGVAHCPRSHAFFGHKPFPRAALEAAGVTVCLGTDSLASVSRGSEPPALDLLAELRVLAGSDPGLSPETLVAMATVHGAVALGQRGRLGELAPGAAADLIGLPFAGPRAGVAAAVVAHGGPVPVVMIGGKWIAGIEQDAPE